MSNLERVISIHPYFKIQEDQMEACHKFLAAFNEKVVNEEKCLYYNFTFNGNMMFCREAYQDAEGVAAHLENCGAVLGEFLKIAELVKIELHGPEEELDKLKSTFADMNPEYYSYACGIGR